MEQTYAIIMAGKVVNAVVWDGVAKWAPPEGSTLVSLADHPHAGIGWDWDGENFVDNRPPIEEE